MRPRERLRRAVLAAWGNISRPWRAARSGAPVRRILVIRPDHLGDLLLAFPAIHLLRAAFPSAAITALVGPWGRAVIERHPAVAEVRTCEFPGFTRQSKGSLLAPYRLLAHEADRLRDFDLAVVLRHDHWWGALLAHTAGIPQRWGYDVPECAPFLTTVVPYVSGQHAAAQNLALIQGACAALGISCPVASAPTQLEFPYSAAEAAFARELLASRGVPETAPLVAIHPGAGAAVKLWPAERYAQVADALHAEWGACIVLTGSRDELRLAWAVAATMRHDPIVLAGMTSLGQLAALLAACDLVIGADSGPLHLAVAVGTPTLHLYGPADPRLFGPWSPHTPERHHVIMSPRPCAPCHRLDYAPGELPAHPCMAEIGVAQVLDAIARMRRAGVV